MGKARWILNQELLQRVEAERRLAPPFNANIQLAEETILSLVGACRTCLRDKALAKSPAAAHWQAFITGIVQNVPRNRPALRQLLLASAVTICKVDVQEAAAGDGGQKPDAGGLNGNGGGK